MTETWTELFILELHVRGAVIGDAIAGVRVRELLADSRQSAEEVFGSAREYAASLVDFLRLNTVPRFGAKGSRSVQLPRPQ